LLGLCCQQDAGAPGRHLRAKRRSYRARP
jgi:hypothetical protein